MGFHFPEQRLVIEPTEQHDKEIRVEPSFADTRLLPACRLKPSLVPRFSLLRGVGEHPGIRLACKSSSNFFKSAQREQ